MELITLYNKEGEKVIVEKGSQGETEMKAVGFSESKPKTKKADK